LEHIDIKKLEELNRNHKDDKNPEQIPSKPDQIPSKKPEQTPSKPENVPVKPVRPPRLDLDYEWAHHILEEAENMKNQFLEQSEFQFSEYLSLTAIQLVFDQHMDQKEFISLFKDDSKY